MTAVSIVHHHGYDINTGCHSNLSRHKQCGIYERPEDLDQIHGI